MSTPFRYLIAIVTALLLILGPFCCVMWFTQSFRSKYAKLARETHIAAGDFAAANRSDSEVLQDFGTEVNEAEMIGLTISDLLYKFWWFWCLLVIAVCYGLFLLLGWMLPVTGHVPKD